MSTSDSNDSDSLLEEAATEWLLEREDGFSPGRADAFAQWRSSDPRHAAAIARVEQTLALLDEMPAIRGSLEAQLGRAGAKRSRNFSRWSWAAGIAAAGVIGTSVWWMAKLPVPASEYYEVEGSEPQRVALSDGSVIDLNGHSRVEVQFTGDERHVTLTEGEAHFQVAHNKARPFVVTAHGVAVRAVGTAFNVRLIADRIDVLVAEGKVEVARRKTSAFFATKTTPVVPLLVAGERTQVMSTSDSIPQVEEIPATQVQSLLAWQNRMTSFTDVPLSEMVARINHCNSVKLVIGDPQLGDRRVGGVIDLKQLDAFLHLLEQDGDIVSERISSEEIVLRRAR